jgi:single-strand DNA-binding protein
MSDFNKVILMGNLTKDPELRFTSDGKAIGKLRLAVNRKWKDKDGEKQNETSFFNITSFGKSAEIVSQYVEKGSPLLIDGRLRSYSYESEGGEKKYGTEVVMDTFQFLPQGAKAAESA